MIRKIVQAIFAVTAILVGLYSLSESEYQKDVIVYGTVGLLVLTELIIEFIIFNRKRLKLILHCIWLSLRRQRIRFSMSYLYRIKIDDKYLLVRNNNFGHYQLVGGKYKILEGTKAFIQNKFNAIDDPKLPNKGLMKGDFALFIPAKKAIKFLDWFNQGKDREINHWREFYEELIGGKEKLLDQKIFSYVNYNFKGKVRTPIKRTPGWDCYEILQYDILDLLPTKEQEQELRKLLGNGETNYYKWADQELIECLGHDNRLKEKIYGIGIHTKWAINMKWSKE